MKNTLEELIGIIYPFIQQLDIGTRNGKWIVQVYDKKGQFYSSGRFETLDEALVCIGLKIKAIISV